MGDFSLVVVFSWYFCVLVVSLWVNDGFIVWLVVLGYDIVLGLPLLFVNLDVVVCLAL